MNKYDLIRELKADLKLRAAEIRSVRAASKARHRNPDAEWTGPREHRLLDNATKEFRYLHITYCLLRGRTIEQIEPNVRPGNEADPHILESIQQVGAAFYRHSRLVIWPEGAKYWQWKVESTRHLWDKEFAKIHAVKEHMDNMGRTSFENVSIGQWQKLKDLMRKALGGK